MHCHGEYGWKHDSTASLDSQTGAVQAGAVQSVSVAGGEVTSICSLLAVAWVSAYLDLSCLACIMLICAACVHGRRLATAVVIRCGPDGCCCWPD